MHTHGTTTGRLLAATALVLVAVAAHAEAPSLRPRAEAYGPSGPVSRPLGTRVMRATFIDPLDEIEAAETAAADQKTAESKAAHPGEGLQSASLSPSLLAEPAPPAPMQEAPTSEVRLLETASYAATIQPTPKAASPTPVKPAPAAAAIPAFEAEPRRLLGATPAAPTGEATTAASSRIASMVQQWTPWGDSESSEAGNPIVATVGALTVVLGLFLLSAWVLKKSMPRSSRTLPGDVVQVLGRATLVGKQTAQLLKVGRKLVLVSVTPEGVEPITEVSDPEEVNRLLELCEADDPNNASAAFREIFDEISREPRGGSLFSDNAPLVNPHALASAYASTPGGQGRA
ncbi:Flagellar biosynthesis protein, FliO [Pseudobythopirellula maris]|uniref:Flagellar biosynthesis protein, FliO n=1 Tax=Pseudobythopirellula maris TaxID=2527991 RepID=A0A5C5ZH70_9BACT|nr:flagellar biosynthetic protein FliO [Pseudobythopirellula maris]TWT86508.1 Flagellar biosynthesis protein, FliO [Pseudobythopirellula maris]